MEKIKLVVFIILIAIGFYQVCKYVDKLTD